MLAAQFALFADSDYWCCVSPFLILAGLGTLLLIQNLVKWLENDAGKLVEEVMNSGVEAVRHCFEPTPLQREIKRLRKKMKEECRFIRSLPIAKDEKDALCEDALLEFARKARDLCR